jgi:hypothetical protein
MGLVDDARWDFHCRKQEAVSRETTSRALGIHFGTRVKEESTAVFGQPISS